MNVYSALGVYSLVVFVGGACLAPWLYHTAHFLAADSALWVDLIDHPFRRYVNRCLLALAIVGLWPLANYLKINELHNIGLRWDGNSRCRVIQGFGVGFLSLVPIVTLHLMSGIRVWKEDLHWSGWPALLIGAVLSGLAVACIEEILFRGLIFQAFRRVQRWPWAALSSGVVYALAHFFAQPPNPEKIHAWSGLLVLAQMLSGFLEWKALVPNFFNLCLIGWMLAFSVNRTGHLWFAIGMHGAWVFWLRLYRKTTWDGPAGPNPFFGSKAMVDGFIAAFMLGLVLVWMRRLLPKKIDR